ncbi:MAG TPA: M28 family peptidase [Vicinamibacterales bacterium]|nr:M28 family peptidase [Vicinamibacterales bacterium]
MRRFLFVSATLVVSSVPCLSGASLLDAYHSKQAYAYTAQIVGFGERQPGQVGHRKTEDLILKVLHKDGAQIERDDFTARTPRGLVSGHNIIGKFNVTADPQQPVFILAGHYDTLVKKGFVGANDGGSSTAILLSFADALAHQKTKMQIWLFWTDVEEGTFDTFEGHPDGLYGSMHYAQKLAASGLVPRIKGFFLLDMIGDKDLNVARESQSTRWLQDFISQAARQLGYTQHFFQYATAITDDQVSFLTVGIPAVDVVDAQFGRMGPNFDGMGEFHHANTDTMDKVSQKSLEIVGRTILLTVELVDAQS